VWRSPSDGRGVQKEEDAMMRISEVDPGKYPHLYGALRRGQERQLEGWKRIIELRKDGQHDAADRLVRKILGIQGPPMSEETKEKLRRYNEEHAEEIKARKQQEREVRKRTIAILTTGRKRKS
jgi:hypothetical protein